jgi:hypothetical protein
LRYADGSKAAKLPWAQRNTMLTTRKVAKPSRHSIHAFEDFSSSIQVRPFEGSLAYVRRSYRRDLPDDSGGQISLAPQRQVKEHQHPKSNNYPTATSKITPEFSDVTKDQNSRCCWCFWCFMPCILPRYAMGSTFAGCCFTNAHTECVERRKLWGW